MPRSRRGRGTIWGKHNLFPTEGIGKLQRRSPGQQDDYVDVDPQPEVMIIVVDEADPHANQRDKSFVQYGILFVLRTDDVRDSDIFTYQPPGGRKFRWGVLGQGRWDMDHALTNVNFGVKMFRVRQGG